MNLPLTPLHVASSALLGHTRTLSYGELRHRLPHVTPATLTDLLGVALEAIRLQMGTGQVGDWKVYIFLMCSFGE